MNICPSKSQMRIGISGKARAGKDTLAAAIVEKIPADVLSFAAPVYEIANMVQTTLGRPCVKDRGLLIMIGQGLRELYGEDVWVNKLVAQITPGANIIVTDVRLPNEYAMLVANGFTMVRVDRTDRPTDEFDNHITETALDNMQFDHVLGSADQIQEFITDLVTSFGIK